MTPLTIPPVNNPSIQAKVFNLLYKSDEEAEKLCVPLPPAAPFPSFFSSCCQSNISWIKLCKCTSPSLSHTTHTHTKSLCEVDTSRQVCREMPGIVSPLHNCCCLARWNSISRLFCGCNGPTKAPNAFPEKRLLSRHHSMCPYTPHPLHPSEFQEGVYSLSPCLTGGHCCPH